MSYDPTLRRDTPLAAKLKQRIASSGPVPVHLFVRACLHDPEFGYYRRRAAIGRAGDFITAPEISQVFGELIGLWCVVVWQQMGAPSTFRLIEIGPGRGTLMRDVLRAARLVPSFRDAAVVTLVETNDVLRAEQAQCLGATGVQPEWFEDIDAVPFAPAIVVGNEFLDTVAPVQMIKTARGWCTRAVGLDGAGNLAFTSLDDPKALDGAVSAHAPLGAIAETQSFDELGALGLRAARHDHACLFIDYGHDATAFGDTLQAVRSHAFEHPLTSPGEADLSVQVDFEAATTFFRDIASGFDGGASRLVVDGPVTQAEFLGALGIAERASRLMAANPSRANDIEMGVARLMSPQGMGTRFKVMGVRTPGLPMLPGFSPRS